ncbi:MAG: hypothetical protein FWD13_09910 [Treponema sp.]|nr:hypothetical protein [Treponema sp.]
MKKNFLFLFVVFISLSFASCGQRNSLADLLYDLPGIVKFAIIVWIATIIFTIVIAKMKGYSGILAFLLGLFIPLLGSTIIILLLPDQNTSYRGSTQGNLSDLSKVSASNLKKVNTGDTWVCKKCNETNPIISST